MADAFQAQFPADIDDGAGRDSSGQITAGPMPAGSSYEESIAAIWRDVLGRRDIGVSDDFFDLNGHSLHAIKVVARIRKTLGVDIPVRDFFDAPTVGALAAVVAARSSFAAASLRPLVSRRPADAPPVLSFDQQRIWLESQLRPDGAYNVHGRRRLAGPLDVAVLEASIRAILVRHEALRTRFPTVSGRPVQAVDDPDENWRLAVADLSGEDGGEATARRLADEQASAPFDLVSGPLFRCLLIKLSDTDHILSVTIHHIVSDGWSVGVLIHELKELYQAGGDPRRAGLPDLPVQYRDYAVWQRSWLVGEALDRQVSYWRRHLAGAPPGLALPTTTRHSPAQGAISGRVRSVLSADQTAALHDLCHQYGVTWFMTLLASLATVLGRWSGQPDVVIGVPIAGRTDAGTDKLIGFFVNTLPFRIDLSGNPTFADLLDRARRGALGGCVDGEAPLDVLVKELQAIRDPNRTPLFQVLLNAVDTPEIEHVGGITIQAMDAPVPPSKLDLSLTARESHGVLHFELDFNAERYDTTMMRTLLSHLTTLLHAATDDPAKPIHDYPLETTLQPPAVLASQAPAAPHLAVERHAGLADRTAVIDRDGEWGYGWLCDAADRVAELLASQQLRVADVVWRSTAASVAVILGCMKAGTDYSVIEPGSLRSLPEAGLPPVLDASLAGAEDDRTISLSVVWRAQDGQVGSSLRSSQSAATTPSADWAVGRFALSAHDRFAVLSTLPGHLLSAMSSAFHAGAALVIPELPLTGGIDNLITSLQVNSISVMYVTPPVLRALAAHLPQPQLPALRHAFIDNSGDLIAHDIQALRLIAPSCRCVGVYRMDQDGRPLAIYPVPDEWKLQTAPLRVPLGTELEGSPAGLMNASWQPAAVSEVAEICIGSHRTGDMGRRRHDGTLDFVCQRGARPGSDLAETLGALRDLPEVRDAVVTEQAGPDGRALIHGYVVGPDPGLGVAGIQQRLATRLPQQLVPERLLIVDVVPLTAAGDYDLGALAGLDAEAGPADGYVAPRTPMESQLTEMLTELLAADRVGIYDSFFDLGGFSLLATRLASRIREMFEVELSLRDVFESPTVDQLAQTIVRLQCEQWSADSLEALLDEIA
jgi:non-ribosomal peptide synthetase component F/acyl carrier protein